MPVAAIPAYLGNNFSEASPGLRFGMYLQLWGINRRTNARLWSTHDIDYEVRGQNKQEREVRCENKVSALNNATKLNRSDKDLMAALQARLEQSFNTVPANNRLQIAAISTAPFTTGLGNEHPLENGFAFLNPYGLPYLPGSGVKGVMRQAARELASGDWGDNHGWDDVAITVLFGKESQDGDTEYFRGVLTFWDVIPQIKGDSLAVEIMTPHQGHYYQNGQSPHDSGQPVPISFLTVPAGSGFTFHVQCNLFRLQNSALKLAQNSQWKKLLEAAFEHAFAWLGFGAKTAVGYGAMTEDQQKKAEQQMALNKQQEIARKEREKVAREQEIATMSPVDKAIAEYLDGRPDKNQPEINALLAGLKQNKWDADLSKEIALKLKMRMETEKKWREKSEKKNPEKDEGYQNTLLVKKFL